MSRFLVLTKTSVASGEENAVCFSNSVVISQSFVLRSIVFSDVIKSENRIAIQALRCTAQSQMELDLDHYTVGSSKRSNYTTELMRANLNQLLN